MSKIPNNSYPVPRDLEQSDYFKTAKPLWKLVMYWLLSHAVYKDELPYDINGSKTILKRGQVVFTLRQISDELDISKDIVDAAILHFSGYTTKRTIGSLMAAGRQPFFFRQNFRQEVRQEKSVYNIAWDGYYETCPTELPTELQTTFPTARRQAADINKKDKKDKKEVIFLNTPGEVEVGALTRRFFALDKKTKSFLGLTKKDIDGWKKTYEYLKPEDYLEEMASWLIKHKEDAYLNQIPRKFFTTWLAKNNLINQTNANKGKANVNRSTSSQRERDQMQGRFVNGQRDDSPFVAGAKFFKR